MYMKIYNRSSRTASLQHRRLGARNGSPRHRCAVARQNLVPASALGAMRRRPQLMDDCQVQLVLSKVHPSRLDDQPRQDLLDQHVTRSSLIEGTPSTPASTPSMAHAASLAMPKDVRRVAPVEIFHHLILDKLARELRQPSQTLNRLIRVLAVRIHCLTVSQTH